MEPSELIYRAQVYRFLAWAFVYPQENWLEDLPALASILEKLEYNFLVSAPTGVELGTLQADYRHTLGLSGSLLYETEIGLPDEFRQSQEMADIAGFYRAFGFSAGGAIRERPDYLAMELEFMGLLALKEAYAAGEGNLERVEICKHASTGFLNDHLGRWIELFADSLSRAAGISREADLSEKPYLWVARLAADFVSADAEALGVDLKPIPLRAAIPTPLGPELSCGGCPAAH